MRSTKKLFSFLRTKSIKVKIRIFKKIYQIQLVGEVFKNIKRSCRLMKGNKLPNFKMFILLVHEEFIQKVTSLMDKETQKLC